MLKHLNLEESWNLVYVDMKILCGLVWSLTDVVCDFFLCLIHDTVSWIFHWFEWLLATIVHAG